MLNIYIHAYVPSYIYVVVGISKKNKKNVINKLYTLFNFIFSEEATLYINNV